MKAPTKDDVKAVRKAADLTLKAAGAVVYSAESTWHHWENGKRQMPTGLFELFLIKTKVKL